ncbi:MAG: aminotransferase class I/II-fold pyridoxal phosphate-dependent enzyme [Candidatus Sumerlaeia bacterium]|nr:aminotransferase class I/II-fold pyridoxal phosphate-dependent enzyme [Candidatus Sumerlaeia bacterium]
MTPETPLAFDSLAIHAGLPIPADGSPVAPPIVLSSTFEHPAPEDLDQRRYLYGRYDNPNRKSLEEALAALEGGAVAYAFSSGNMATHAMLHALPPGSRILYHRDIYSGTRRAMRELWQGRLEFAEADLRDHAEAERALAERPTALLWIETPSNPLLHVLDIAALAALARRHGAHSLVDNTWATPVLQCPLALGADVVLHSTSKYIGGHTDLIGGALVLRGAGPLAESLRSIQFLGGGVPSPFDCWLARRGLMTLPVRVRAHVENGRRVAEYLRAHPKVSQVYFPGFAGPADAALVARQMKAPGAVLSFRHADGDEAASRLPGKLRLVRNATSLGGVESLLEWRYPSEGPNSPTPKDLLRLSVGLEDPADIERDLDRALRG